MCEILKLHLEEEKQPLLGVFTFCCCFCFCCVGKTTATYINGAASDFPFVWHSTRPTHTSSLLALLLPLPLPLLLLLLQQSPHNMLTHCRWERVWEVARVPSGWVGGVGGWVASTRIDCRLLKTRALPPYGRAVYSCSASESKTHARPPRVVQVQDNNENSPPVVCVLVWGRESEWRHWECESAAKRNAAALPTSTLQSALNELQLCARAYVCEYLCECEVVRILNCILFSKSLIFYYLIINCYWFIYYSILCTFICIFIYFFVHLFRHDALCSTSFQRWPYKRVNELHGPWQKQQQKLTTIFSECWWRKETQKRPNVSVSVIMPRGGTHSQHTCKLGNISNNFRVKCIK